MSNYNNQYNPRETNTSWSLAEKYIKENAIILEIGAGNGNFAEAMSVRRNCQVEIIEPDTSDAVLAKSKVKRVFNDTLENVIDKLQEHRYDHVVLLDVIEHVKDPVEALTKIRRVLKKEGSVIFSMPNMAHMSVRLMLLSGTFSYGKTGLLDGTHLHFYTKSEINRVFIEAGYVIESLDGVTEDIEDSVILNELAKIGIKKSDTLLKSFRENDGVIYQYIGKAKPSSRKLKTEKLPECSPNVGDMRKDYYQAENERLLKVIADKDEVIISLQDKKSGFLHRLRNK